MLKHIFFFYVVYDNKNEFQPSLVTCFFFKQVFLVLLDNESRTSESKYYGSGLLLLFLTTNFTFYRQRKPY